MSERLRGVIAAIATPVSDRGQPDLGRFLSRAARLLSSGCDALNVLGTTGEATSFSLAQRLAVMRAAAGSGLSLSRMMVGTGAAAVEDAAELTLEAAALGFAGALVLPPFYYKPVPEAGILRYFECIVEATTGQPIGLYLYNFPALAGVTYTPSLVALLQECFGERIVGLKDSSGDVAYARRIAALSPALDVFPSNEANLLLARGDGPFAGCISATANINSADCARAYKDGDAAALARAVAIRSICDGLPLVPAVKSMVAYLEGDEAHARVLPPFAPLSEADRSLLIQRYQALEDPGLRRAEATGAQNTPKSLGPSRDVDQVGSR
jgi:4-hydroxy-tetrahydrodipicolinate synthase